MIDHNSSFELQRTRSNEKDHPRWRRDEHRGARTIAQPYLLRHHAVVGLDGAVEDRGGGAGRQHH